MSGLIDSRIVALCDRRRRDAFRFGTYKVTVGSVPFDSMARYAGNRTRVLAAPFGEAAAIPTEWSDTENVAWKVALPGVPCRFTAGRVAANRE